MQYLQIGYNLEVLFAFYLFNLFSKENYEKK